MGVEVFSSAGKDPGRQWKVSQNIHRVYDRSVKGFVFLLEKGATTNMSIPPAEGKELLGLIQPLLVFQVRLQPGKHFGFDVVVQDDKGNKRRLYFSSTFRDFENHGLHVQVPLAIDALDGWINMIVDLGMLMHLCFRGSHLHSILSISLKPVCRVRRIFTMPYSNSSGTSDGGAINIPAMFDFPAGTEFSNTVSRNIIYLCNFIIFVEIVLTYNYCPSTIVIDYTRREPGHDSSGYRIIPSRG